MESFDALYANIGIFNQALVGNWVFHGEYMFSQHGRGATKNNGMVSNSVSYSEYDDPQANIQNYLSNKRQYDQLSSGVSSASSWFCPNIFFNAVTGSFSLASGKIYNGSDGTLFSGKTSYQIGSTLDSILTSSIWGGEDYPYTHSIGTQDHLIFVSKLLIPSSNITQPGTFTLKLKSISDLINGRTIRVTFLGDGLTKCTKKLECYTYGREERISFLNLPTGRGNSGITTASSFNNVYTIPAGVTTIDIHFIQDGTTTYAAIC